MGFAFGLEGGMIEVKIGDVVHVVRTRAEWNAVERLALDAIRRQESAALEAKAREWEAGMLAAGWVRHGATLVRWTRGTWEVTDHGPWSIKAPVKLWARHPGNAWHLVEAGFARSGCPWEVALSEGMEVAVPEPLDKVCSQCAKRGAP